MDGIVNNTPIKKFHSAFRAVVGTPQADEALQYSCCNIELDIRQLNFQFSRICLWFTIYHD